MCIHFGKLSIAAVVTMFASTLAADSTLQSLTHDLTELPPGVEAPALRLPDMDQTTRDLEDLRGDVVIVNFWATWCPPCRREMPSLERLHQETADQGIDVIAVDVGEDVDTVFAFLGAMDPTPTFPMLFDRDSTSMAAWAVKGLPTTYVIAPDGSLAYVAIGGRAFDHPAVIARLQALRDTEREPNVPLRVVALPEN